jgi:hypothetical protein
MRPDASARNILSTTRATAKMHEFRAASVDFIALPRDPAILFALAIGIHGDGAAAVADAARDDADAAPLAQLPIPLVWGDRGSSPREGLRFASLFFDAFLNARLDETISTEFSLLCSAAIRENGCQNPQNRREIMADSKLQAVFGGAAKATMFEVPKHLNQHLA